jgi:hypothetical protein
MTDVDSKSVEDFISSGRVGRRNALPDILDEKVANTDTSALPSKLEKLTCSDEDESKKSDTACADPKENKNGEKKEGDKSNEEDKEKPKENSEKNEDS